MVSGDLISREKRCEIWDISPMISARIAVFPGDTPFRETFVMEMENGDNLTLSSISTTVHLGAHADSPRHYKKNGEGIERRPLNLYMGPAEVIEVPLRKGQRIEVRDLDISKIQCSRVLFKTQSFPEPDQWNKDFMSLSAELVNALAQKGVRLVGIDTPSIDPAEDKVLESHQAIAENDMAILEGLVLDRVSPGVYELIALPLKIEGADASPVRAILRRP